MKMSVPGFWYILPNPTVAGAVGKDLKRVGEVYLIMRNRENGEYRYFIPYANSYLLDRVHTVMNRNSLRTLRRNLEKLNLVEYITSH